MLCDAVAVFPEPLGTALPGWDARHQAWTAEHAPGNVASDNEWLLHFHSFLLTGTGGVTLIDTGIGPAGGLAAEWLGTTGRLPELLAAAGVAPEDVTTVVLTHVHLDHAGWNTDQDRPRFTNASYVVQSTEVAHIRDSETYERLLRPIEDAGQLRAVDGEVTLAPDLRLLPTPGHTAGHQSVLTDTALLAGDVLVHPAQARWPELTYVYERDPEVAVASRRTVLELAARTGVRVEAAHPAGPFRVDPDGVRMAPGHG